MAACMKSSFLLVTGRGIFYFAFLPDMGRRVRISNTAPDGMEPVPQLFS